MENIVLRVEELTKEYGKKCALDHFSYDFTPGIYGLLGPNGAGKSTLMKCITQNIDASLGGLYYNDILIKGYQKEYISKIGYMPQQQRLFDNFTGAEFLYYMASLKGLSKKEAGEQIPYFLERVHLFEESKRRIDTYSGGMKQRLLIAQALLGDPRIVLMDEPTAGLDPKERIHIRNLISEFAKDRIVIIATHVVSDIEYISKKILILNHGKLVSSGTSKELTEVINNKVFEADIAIESFNQFIKEYRVISATPMEDEYRVRFLCDKQPDIPSICVTPNLEDVYLFYFSDKMCG